MRCSKIGQQIGKLRSRRNITQTELGNAIGVSKNTVEKWENGRNAIKDDMIVKLADFFGVSCDELILGVSPENTLVCRELGLSSDSIDMLKELAILNKQDNSKNVVAEMIDILLQNQVVLLALHIYFFEKSQNRKLLSDDEISLIKQGILASDDISPLKKEQIEALHEMVIMYGLREIKREMEEKNETGKW